MEKTLPQNPRTFKTRDIYISATLHHIGVPLIRVESNGRQGIFVFEASPQIDELITKYLNGTLTVNPKGLFDDWKALKAMAFSTIGDVK